MNDSAGPAGIILAGGVDCITSMEALLLFYTIILFAHNTQLPSLYNIK